MKHTYSILGMSMNKFGMQFNMCIVPSIYDDDGYTVRLADSKLHIVAEAD